MQLPGSFTGFCPCWCKLGAMQSEARLVCRRYHSSDAGRDKRGSLCFLTISPFFRSNLSPIHRQALGKANKCVWLCWSMLDKMSAWGWILFRAVIISCVLECNEYMSAVFLSGIQDGQRWYRALRGKTRQHGLHGEGLATFSHTNTHTHTQKQTLLPTTQLCEHDIVQAVHAAQTRHTDFNLCDRS